MHLIFLFPSSKSWELVKLMKMLPTAYGYSQTPNHVPIVNLPFRKMKDATTCSVQR